MQTSDHAVDFFTIQRMPMEMPLRLFSCGGGCRPPLHGRFRWGCYAEGSLPLDVASVCHAQRCDWP